MSGAAKVTSLDAMRDFRAALAQFGHDASDAIVMLNLEARKAIDWLEHDRARYWPQQLRRAQEWVARARNELERCQLHYGSEEAPSCYEQKKALEKARRRLKECEEKVQMTKQWMRAIRKELDEFEGEMARMMNWSDTDLPRALAALEGMIQVLDRYAGDHRKLNAEG